jgi:iron-sulfur cluster assembly accessory protein
MINITESAADHIKGIGEAQKKVVQLGVKGGGCAGFAYDWSLIDESEIDVKQDEVIDLYNGAKLVVGGTSLMYLFGATIDFKKDIFGATLEIETPAAESACGCGESVNFDMDMVEQNQQAFDDGMNGDFRD